MHCNMPVQLPVASALPQKYQSIEECRCTRTDTVHTAQAREFTGRAINALLMRGTVLLLACAGMSGMAGMAEDSCLFGDGWEGFSDSSHDMEGAYRGYWPQLRTFEQCRQECCANPGSSRPFRSFDSARPR